MLKFSQKILNPLYLVVLLLLFSTSNIYAQAGSGTLSFNPSTVTIAQNGTATLNIVYTGVETTAAKIKINIGPGLKITDFEENDDLMVIINDPDNGEIHLGKLSEGNITSGTTLLAMTVQATGCGSGSISFDQNEVVIPDVTLTFNNATYTINCSGTTSATTTPTSTGGTTTQATPSTLPKTDIIDDDFGKIIIAAFLITAGIALAYYIKVEKQMSLDPDTEFTIT